MVVLWLLFVAECWGPVVSVLACCHDRTTVVGAVFVGCAAVFWFGLGCDVIGAAGLGLLLGAVQRVMA